MLQRMLSFAAATALLPITASGFSGAFAQEVATDSTPAASEVSIQKIFSGSETLNGTPLKYPEGKPELRLFRVEIPAGGKIPLHTHPAPMLVYVQANDSGSLLNTRVQPDGSEQSSVFEPGQSFIEGASEPHYVQNTGSVPTIVWVMVASAEGLPTTEFIKAAE